MRGVHELALEEKAVLRNTNLSVVNKIAIYTYLPSYFHVSPHQAKLAKRLETGLKQLDKAGWLKRQLQYFFNDAMTLTSQKGRKVVFLENTNLPPGTFQRDKQYLLNLVARN